MGRIVDPVTMTEWGMGMWPNMAYITTDTDSLLYEIETEDFYKDINPDVEKWFDTSKYSESHPSGMETGINKKVLGMMKDELGDKPMTQFVGLSAKLYSYEISDG